MGSEVVPSEGRQLSEAESSSELLFKKRLQKTKDLSEGSGKLWNMHTHRNIQCASLIPPLSRHRHEAVTQHHPVKKTPVPEQRGRSSPHQAAAQLLALHRPPPPHLHAQREVPTHKACVGHGTHPQEQNTGPGPESLSNKRLREDRTCPLRWLPPGAGGWGSALRGRLHAEWPRRRTQELDTRPVLASLGLSVFSFKSV